MDSLRLPKINSAGNKSPANASHPGLSVGVRFNAGEEVIEEILLKQSISALGGNPKDSPHSQQSISNNINQEQSNNPSQNIEDFNWRKDILQGGFFNRKRSGSIDGNKNISNIQSSNASTNIATQSNSNNGQAGCLELQSATVNLSSVTTDGATSCSNANQNANNASNSSSLSNCESVGTWKLIKGKVSQAMEDIKSSKSSQTQPQHQQQQQQQSTKSTPTNEDSDGGGETASIHSNPENHQPNDLLGSLIQTSMATANSSTSSTYNLPSLRSQHKYFGFSRRSNKSDSDTEDDNETSVMEDFIESSSLRKSFANLKTKAKTHLQSSSSKKDSSNITSDLGSTAITITASVSAAATPFTSVASPSASSQSLNLGSGIRSTFLRKRNKKQSPDKTMPTLATTTITIADEFVSSESVSSNGNSKKEKEQIRQNNNDKIKLKKKYFEIESGVEMFEDMDLPNVVNDVSSNFDANAGDNDVNSRCNSNTGHFEGLKISLSTDTITLKKKKNKHLLHQQTVPNFLSTSLLASQAKFARGVESQQQNINETADQILKCKNSRLRITFNSLKNYLKCLADVVKSLSLQLMFNTNFLISVLLFLILLIVPIADFFRGIVACLCIITLCNSFSDYFWTILNHKFKNLCLSYIGGACAAGTDAKNSNGEAFGPQYSKFEIPDFRKMSILEIPVIEEHKSLKIYSGWMNEVNNYDPNSFHQSMTRSVYIRLDGSILRILNTSTRVSKRSMWNENPIDRKNIIFTCSRTFNLTGARIEMLPKGLARKRYFSRKYPLQLIVKNSDNYNKFRDDETTNFSSALETISVYNNEDEIQFIGNSNNGAMSSGSVKSILDKKRHVIHQNSNESNEESRSTEHDQQLNDMNFGETLLNSDLQKLQDTQDPIALKETIPCGDETRILLFARCDREKEDWYRRFNAASIGEIHDQDLKIPDIVMITDDEVSQTIRTMNVAPIQDQSTENLNQANNTMRNVSEKDCKQQVTNSPIAAAGAMTPNSNNASDTDVDKKTNSAPTEEASDFEGLLFSADAARNPPEYIKFMSRYQKACTQNKIPVVKYSLIPNETPTKRNRRQKRQEDELWKGINQTLYLAPSGSIVWANVLIGRVLFSCLSDSILLEKIQDFLQRKLSAIRLPSFMEDVSIAHINLGDAPPLVHRISQPRLDERGTWIDADVTYEGLLHMTITTKLNLLRLKRSQHQHGNGGSGGTGNGGCSSNAANNINPSSQQHVSSGGMTSLIMNTVANQQINSASSTQNMNVSVRPSSALSDRNITDRPSFISSSGSCIHQSGSNIAGLTTSTGVPIIGATANKNEMIESNSLINDTFKAKQTNEPSLAATSAPDSVDNDSSTNLNANMKSEYNSQTSLIVNSAIYDSNAESSGASSSESESPTTGSTFDIASESQANHPAPGSSRRFLRIVDRITASNIFQSATEISYIQRAMENMSTKITLRVELKGLVSRVVVNIPPPPSDRIWLAFRGPPRLWISAKPAVGDHAFDWSVVTNVIENKLCDEVYKYLVYPNMVDIIVPFLGQSTYTE